MFPFDRLESVIILNTPQVTPRIAGTIPSRGRLLVTLKVRMTKKKKSSPKIQNITFSGNGMRHMPHALTFYICITFFDHIYIYKFLKYSRFIKL